MSIESYNFLQLAMFIESATNEKQRQIKWQVPVGLSWGTSNYNKIRIIIIVYWLYIIPVVRFESVHTKSHVKFGIKLYSYRLKRQILSLLVYFFKRLSS